jgi:POT family proton-dependent oligopeptide transporter
MATAAATATRHAEGTFMGHPRGLFVLFFAEMWERMSYYGMRSLLALYMVNHLFVRPDIGKSVLGFNFISHVFETGFHAAWTPQPLQSWVYGLYTGFVYLTPFFGGLLADRLLGRRKAVIVGGVLMAIGHFLMAMENMFFLALMFLILGNGCFKPNISTQVGGLYPPGDHRRDSAFSIFYVGINVGAFLAPIICGTLGQTPINGVQHWHWGFAAAGVGMVLGLIVYVSFQKYLPVEPPPTESKTKPLAGILAFLVGIPLMILGLLFLFTLPRQVPIAIAVLAGIAIVAGIARLHGDERPRVIAICVACFIVAAFWAVYEQQGNTLQLWADANTHWPTVLGFTIPSTWYQAFNPFAIWIITPMLTGFWAWQANRNMEPTSLTKMAMGCVMLGLGFIIMIVAAQGMAPDARRSIMWLVTSTVVYTLGELYLSPIGLSFVTKVAPVKIVSMMMGVWFLANFIGNYMTGYLGTFYEKMPKDRFFLMLTVIGVVAGLVLFVMSRPMEKIVAAHDRPNG